MKRSYIVSFIIGTIIGMWVAYSIHIPPNDNKSETTTTTTTSSTTVVTTTEKPSTETSVTTSVFSEVPTETVTATVSTYMSEAPKQPATEIDEITTTQNTTTSQTHTTTEVFTPSASDAVDWIEFNCSAYCSCVQCTGSGAGITASGNKVQADWTIAAPKNYPFGTLIYIDGYGTYCVEDRGGAITGNKLDIYFGTHQEACNFGRRQLRGYVVRWGYGE